MNLNFMSELDMQNTLLNESSHFAHLELSSRVVVSALPEGLWPNEGGGEGEEEEEGMGDGGGVEREIPSYRNLLY